MKLPLERDDPRLERGRATVAARSTPRGGVVRLTVSGLRPEAEEGPVDLSIYGPDPDGDLLPGAAAGAPRYAVVVEATLRVRRGRAQYRFETVRGDVPGHYVAVFRRTDCSSRPVARVGFRLRR